MPESTAFCIFIFLDLLFFPGPVRTPTDEPQLTLGRDKWDQMCNWYLS